MSVDTKNTKLKNATKKTNLSNIKEESKFNYFKSSKSEEVGDSSKSNNDESFNRKHKELHNLWSQYYRDGKTERSLIKRKLIIVLKKRKPFIIFSKDSKRKEHTLEKLLVKIVI